MSVRQWDTIKQKNYSPEEIVRLDQLVSEDLAKMTLQELRKSLGLTQEQLAAVMTLSQPELSRVEKGTNPMLATLRRYIEALGGELEVTAVFGEQRIKVEGI